jgi:excisionase family DNA binding protein
MNRKLLLCLLAVSAPDMSTGDVAKYLGVSTRTVYAMVADGRLRAYKLGKRVIRFRRSEVGAALTPTDAA